MRIVSLLPSATEIVYALGLEDSLAGVTFECDFPADAQSKAIVTGTALTPGQTSEQIDAQVSALVAAGEPVYTLDSEQIREIAPDLILAQDLCAVCAVPSGAVEDALDVLGCTANVVSLDPSSLDEVIGCVGIVGAAANRDADAAAVMAALRARIAAVRTAVAGAPRPRVLALEWADPPFNAGHWVPDMISAAGGESILTEPGATSVRLTWAAIEQAAPEIVLFMPCGYSLDQSIAEGRELMSRPELAGVSQFWALAGDAYFSRPGPRVVDGVEALGAILHPESGLPPLSRAGLRLQ